MSEHTSAPSSGAAADPHGLTALYALDAVDGVERARAEDHLATCAACRDELTELHAELASVVELAVTPVAPRPSLRGAVLSALDGVQQLPPLPRAEVSPAAPVVLARSRGERAHPAHVARPATDELAERRARRSRALAVLTSAAAAVLLVVAGALGWSAHQLREGRDAARATTSALASVASAPDAETVTAAQATGAWARSTVVVSRSRGRAVLVPTGAAAAPSGRTWQLWFIHGRQIRSAGTFTDTGSSAGVPQSLAGQVGSAAVVAITLEPSGGSAQPTMEPVAQFTLPATT